MVKQKYEGSHKEQLSALSDKISEETKLAGSLKRFGEGSNSGTPQAQTVPDRTISSPEWGSGGDRPLNWNKRLQLAAVSVSDLTSPSVLNLIYSSFFGSFCHQLIPPKTYTMHYY